MNGLTVSTASVTDRQGEERAAGEPQLLVVLQCDQPLAPSSRHRLGETHEVRIGRGDRAASRKVEGGVRRLELSLPDAKMSASHATLTLVRGRWILEDAGSKNGSLVNGAAVRRAVLFDGDLVELGNTFLLYRDAVPPAAAHAADLDEDALAAEAPAPKLATFSAPLAAAFEALARVARSTVSVMITGETGTGKEVVARALHELSGRGGPFVAVNCGALPPTLVEATLFGHRRGAFSGAVDDRPGLVRGADKGTLFLDEIGDLPLAMQTAFLRVLQEQEVTPVGDSRPVKVDLRVASATHRQLEKLVEAESFRADLYARMGGLTVELPRLIDRREDLGLLIRAILARHPAKHGFSAGATRALLRHTWPLNVRELEKCVSTATVLAGGAPIKVEHLPAALRPASAPAAARAEDPGDDRLRTELTALLAQYAGNVSEVARVMGKGRMQIHRWMKRFGLAIDAYRR